MFDLLGDSSDSSLTAIELPLINTNDHQKRIWEVEMMGISLSSTNHLSNMLSVLNEEIVVMVSQLDANQTSKFLRLLIGLHGMEDHLKLLP